MSQFKQARTSLKPSSSISILAKVNKQLIALRKGWWVMLLGAAIGVGVAYWRTNQSAPSFESSGRMMVSGKVALPEGAVYSEELSNFFGTQIELMQCAEVRKRAAARVESRRPDLRAIPVNLNIFPQKGTSFFVLTASGEEPNYTQAFLDACMDEYIQYKRELRSETSTTALTAVTEELMKLDKDLQTGETELIDFQKQGNIVFLEEEGNSAAKYLISIRERLADMKTEHRLLEMLSLDQNLERKQKTNPAEVPTADGRAASDGPIYGPESDYLRAKQEISLLQAKKERLSKVMRPGHPKIVSLDSEISQKLKMIQLFRDQSLAQLETRRSSLEIQIKNLEAEMSSWEERALKLNEQIADYNRKKAKVERAKSLSERLLTTVQSVDVNKSIGQDVVQIMERAGSPTTTQPDLVRNLIIGGVSGALIGLGLLMLLAFLDDRAGSAIELQERFDEQVLAQIPREPVKEGRLSILSLPDEQHIFVEAYRNLRSSLHFMSFEGARPKTLLVTSAVPGEGKSTVSANLAITLAKGGSKVLLVDGDLRKGVMHQFFSIASEPGFSEVLRGQSSWQELMVQSPQENLWLITRGKPITNASEFYLGGVTDDFIRSTYPHFDYIVVDSAPVLAKDDTGSLAPKIDAVLFVVRAGVSSMRLTRTAMDTLYKRQVNVLGFILNSADKSSPDYYYYHKYAEYYEPDAPATAGVS